MFWRDEWCSTHSRVAVSRDSRIFQKDQFGAWVDWILCLQALKNATFSACRQLGIRTTCNCEGYRAQISENKVPLEQEIVAQSFAQIEGIFFLSRMHWRSRVRLFLTSSVQAISIDELAYQIPQVYLLFMVCWGPNTRFTIHHASARGSATVPKLLREHSHEILLPAKNTHDGSADEMKW